MYLRYGDVRFDVQRLVAPDPHQRVTLHHQLRDGHRPPFYRVVPHHLQPHAESIHHRVSVQNTVCVAQARGHQSVRSCSKEACFEGWNRGQPLRTTLATKALDTSEGRDDHERGRVTPSPQGNPSDARTLKALGLRLRLA